MMIKKIDAIWARPLFYKRLIGLSVDSLFVVFAFSFGWVHGLGFSNYFKMLMYGLDSKMMQLIEFSLGIELAQVIIVIGIVALYHLLSPLFKIAKRDWILVLSSVVLGITIPMMIERYEPFVKAIF